MINEERARREADEELMLLMSRVEFYVQASENPATDVAWRALKESYGWDLKKIPTYELSLFCHTWLTIDLSMLTHYATSGT